jgi:acetyl-CoA carboxylase biotin carboxylase subunit
MFRKVLIANRGEIAVRIARTCRAMGIGTVAVYSEADRNALHVRVADEARSIGPADARRSYLDAEAIVAAAKATGADAVHPGYGFLSENADFARRVTDAGLVFIGPSPDSIAAMGDKVVSRERAASAGVPVVPGADLPSAAAAMADGACLEEIGARAAALGYPVLVKATAGGGGKGMRIVHEPGALPDAVAAGAREAAAAFGDSRLYLEKYLDRPRHVEVQILADHHGTTLHLGERECSIQRRHQKIIEETPAPHLSPALRARMVEAATGVARAVGYRSAGTVEFLLGSDDHFYFLEMNTRLQVEHPITEWVTGIDLVREQIRIAAGERLGYAQSDVALRGAAIECRIYAEDPAAGFLPRAGTILAAREPSGPGVRIDSGLLAGTSVPVEYDPLLAKVSTWGRTRSEAIARMVQALDETAIIGPATNVAFLRDIARHDAFGRGETHTGFLAEHFPRWAPDPTSRDIAAVVAALLLGDAFAGPHSGPEGLSRREPEDPTASPWATLGPWRLGPDRPRRQA